MADIPPQILLFLVNQFLLASMMHVVYIDSDAAEVIGVPKLLMTKCQAQEHRVVRRHLHLLMLLQVKIQRNA